jgi:hypothetical protein
MIMLDIIFSSFQPEAKNPSVSHSELKTDWKNKGLVTFLWMQAKAGHRSKRQICYTQTCDQVNNKYFKKKFFTYLT